MKNPFKKLDQQNNSIPKKSLDDMTVDELLEQLKKSQGPGDALVMFGPNGPEILAKGPSSKKRKSN